MDKPFEEVEKAYLKRCGINSVADECKAEAEKLKALMRDDYVLMPYDDLYPEYGGRMRLDYVNGCGAWQDVANILIAHGYEVTVRLGDATKVEKELDGADKFVVIEYGEVE